MVEMVVHGTPDYAEIDALGLTLEDIHIFSSNVNPYGPAEAVIDAVRLAVKPSTVAQYPDRLSLELRALLAEHHHVPEDAVVVGNGTADLMWLLALLYLRHRRVAILSPTFGEYTNVASMVDATIRAVPHPGWQHEGNGKYGQSERGLTDCARDLAALAPEIVFICNPNNPTGQTLAPEALELLYQSAPSALWIMDEAYMEFLPEPQTSVEWTKRGNWIVLRSMTKDFALGGLRLGYLVAAPELARTIQTTQSPWNVNALAQVAGIACMNNIAWRRECLARLRTDQSDLIAALQETGHTPLPSDTNFFLVPVRDAPTVRKELLARRLMVRDCTSFGLPNYVRIATQRPAANRLLVAAMTELEQWLPAEEM